MKISRTFGSCGAGADDLEVVVSGLRSAEGHARVADGPLWQGILPYPLPLALHGMFQAS